MKSNKRTPFQRRLAGQIALIARQKVVVAIALVILAVGGRIALLPSIPIPRPAIQDEFCYLLAADTYASGRLTNPTHPLWMHFEGVHFLSHPSYQAKYPPLQGMLLALAQVAFGQPWFGVLLSVGLMCAAIYWALLGFLPPTWAMWGGLFAVARIGLLSYWSESYWGGAATAAAGALVIGAVPRLRTKPDSKVAFIMAVGIALLANSRPFEGAVLSAVCLGAVLMKVPIRWIIRPVVLVLIPVGLWMMYYNYRVTGHAFRMPYIEHDEQYETISVFVWQPGLRPAPHYNFKELRDTYVGWDQRVTLDRRSRPISERYYNFVALDYFFLGSPLTVCLGFLLIRMWRSQPKMRLAIALFGLYLLGIEMETLLIPHYAAPGAALAVILGFAALRRLRYASPKLARFAMAATIFFLVYDLTRPANRWLYDKQAFIARRDAVLERLAQQPGKLLVLVEYGEAHHVMEDWVFNRADIDRSRVVWAREMGPERDQELIDYYPGRQVWKLVDNGDRGYELSPWHPNRTPVLSREPSYRNTPGPPNS